MNIPIEAVNNLAYAFFNQYCDEKERETILPIMKIFDMDYKNGELIYEGCSPSLVYREEDWMYPWDYMSGNQVSADLKEKNRKYGNKIIPLKLKHFDVECLQDVINSMGKDKVNLASGILNSIGWMISFEGSTCRLRFVGGPNFELWNEVIDEPIEPWNYDIEEGAIDWRTGNDWPDGIDLEKDVPKNWADICEDRK